VKLAGTVRQKMYSFGKECLGNILQHGLETLGMRVINESGGIVRVVVVELWAGLNFVLSIDSAPINSPTCSSPQPPTWDFERGGVGSDRSVFVLSTRMRGQKAREAARVPPKC